jgi:hypothetical protein
MVAARAAIAGCVLRNSVFGCGRLPRIPPKILPLLGVGSGRKPVASSIFVARMSDDLGRPPLGKSGGPRVKGQRSPNTRPTGLRRDYILARLERDGRKDLVAAIRANHVSAYTVAVELGWTKRPAPLGTGSGNFARRRQHQLRALTGDGSAGDQIQELRLGPSHNGSLFSSREELERAWQANRDEVMRLFANNGRRPMAWWQFDAPRLGLEWPGRDTEQSYLFEAGVLSEAECAELVRFWRQEFEQAQTPGFTLSVSADRILKGAAARAAHYAWADIPSELVEQWSAEHPVRRRGKRTEPALLGSGSPSKSEVQ